MLNVIAFCISTEQWEFCDGWKRVEEGHGGSRELHTAVGDGARSTPFLSRTSTDRQWGRRQLRPSLPSSDL